MVWQTFAVWVVADFFQAPSGLWQTFGRVVADFFQAPSGLWQRWQTFAGDLLFFLKK
jgi:hypothetical protein